MITIKEIEEKAMTPAKRASAHNDYFAFYVGRPLSYILTIPFLYTNISPNQISMISIIPILIGFTIACFAYSKPVMVLCWIMFFLWNLLDGVDGNVARYRKQFSKMGSVYDAMAGYLAGTMMFFATAILAAHSNGILVRYGFISTEMLLILGGLSGIFDIFPRLIMHKAINTLWDQNACDDIKEKSDFNIVKTIALNLKSCAGGAQVLMLVAILLNITDLYTVCYFLFNTLVMLVLLKNIFKEK